MAMTIFFVAEGGVVSARLYEYSSSGTQILLENDA
jgi:hypothetical protein